MLKIIIGIVLLYLTTQLFIKNMAIRALLFYMGKKYGEEEIPESDEINKLIPEQIAMMFRSNRK